MNFDDARVTRSLLSAGCAMEVVEAKVRCAIGGSGNTLAFLDRAANGGLDRKYFYNDDDVHKYKKLV